MPSDTALVIGGGIAGVQAALDLANAGARVYLVERSPYLGGRMAQLDKTFPTNDCSVCMQSPKLVEAARHPNITVLTNAEVRQVRGSAGDFTVGVVQTPRYVTDACTACDDCSKACPVVVPNEFDVGLRVRKAIYTPYPQAVPSAYVIDREHCLNHGHVIACERCVQACPVEGCIDFLMEPRQLVLPVAAIIVACGGSTFDPRAQARYGYGRFPDVLTGLEFERMLSASGPTAGHLRRLSGPGAPKRLAFVLCVGSRDVNAAESCSRICCMYSIKQALLAKSHVPDLESVDVFFMDLRSFGRGFEEYVDRAREQGVRLVRGRVAEVREGPEGLLVRAEDTETATVGEYPADMVVLATAILPPEGLGRLASLLEVDLDDQGYLKPRQPNAEPLRATRDGIFLCGVATGPKDISDSVAEASGAAGQALAFIAERSRAATEIPAAGGEGAPRVGVFTCHCGNNIAGTVDVASVRDYAKGLPGVAVAENFLFACSEGSIQTIIDRIKEHKLNRVVIPACSPKTHEELFRNALVRAGLNPYLLEMANIRNQCSWVHPREKERATEKAKDLTRGSVARARRSQPLLPGHAPVTRAALVLGGGIAGITAALDLDAQGIAVTLVEREADLGGRLRLLHRLSPEGAEASALLAGLLERLRASRVQVRASSEVTSVDGFVGNFKATVRGPEGAEATVEAGAIVLATGADLYRPKEQGYGQRPNVITNLELEKRLGENVSEKTATFLQCVGARNAEYPGCSRYCCEVAVHQALQLAERGVRVNFLYRDIRTFGRGAERLYREASRKGVRFVRFKEEPTFDGENVTVRDVLADLLLELPTELLVLSVAMRPPTDTVKGLAAALKVATGREGYFAEKHVKLGPVETGIEGVFLAGCAGGPRRLEESVASASGAAAKASALLSQDQVLVDPVVAEVTERRCRWCERCAAICPFHAIEMVERVGGEVARVNPALCKGCGLCVVDCPTGAMGMKGFSTPQVEAQVEALLQEAFS